MSEMQDRSAAMPAQVPVSATKGELPALENPWRTALGFRMPLVGDIIALLGIVSGFLYVYQRVYRTIFLSNFDLGVDVIPIATQDAVIDGLARLTPTILHLWLALAVFLILLFIANLFGRFLDTKIRPCVERGLLQRGRWARWHQWVENDALVRRSVIIAALVVCLPFLYLFLEMLIAVPAQIAANNDAKALKTMVANGCPHCATYWVESRELRGRLIGSTPERLFVLEPSGAIVPLRLDAVEKIVPRALRPAHQ